MSSSSNKLLSSLCKANLSILSQKLSLLQTLSTKHGPQKAQQIFQTPCDIVKASIGQHYRHSMDHIELAALIASTSTSSGNEGGASLHYDLRVRGGTYEFDLDASRKRIVDVVDIFHELQSTLQQQQLNDITNCPVTAHFFLSPNDHNSPSSSTSSTTPNEIDLPSTLGRELGFVVHHAIHHLAMVKIIACGNVGELKEEELPMDFGRAPSTILFDRGVVDDAS